MNAALLDTDILSLYFRNNPKVVFQFQEYLTQYDKIQFSIISYYEILSGLKHRDAHKQLGSFLEFSKQSILLPMTEHSVALSSDLYASSRKSGRPMDDIDLLIAGIALSNGIALVTHNVDHFAWIKELNVMDWSMT
jgi:tRNA(fMet)-specific endonuclease VapC